MKEAEKKLFETFCSNPYIIDKFLGKKIVLGNTGLESDMDPSGIVDYFHYSAGDQKLRGFSEWLSNFIETEKFITTAKKFLESEKNLESERDNKHAKTTSV